MKDTKSSKRPKRPVKHTYRQVAAVMLLLALSLTLTGCDPKFEEAFNSAMSINNAINKFAVDSYDLKLMTKEETSAIVDATDRIAQTAKAAVLVMEGLDPANPEQQTAMLAALGAVTDEVMKLQRDLKIANPASRHKVEAYILTIQTTLNTVRIAIAATKPEVK